MMKAVQSLRAVAATAALATAVVMAGGMRTALAGDDDEYSKVLGSVHVPAGEHAGDATTVNGSVEVGANAVIKDAESVNGSVTLREHSSAESVKTVNGATRLEAGVRVSGDVETVNGRVSLGKDADVAGRLSNVNGEIDVDGAHVGRGIETTNGDINIGPNSRVEGGLLVKEEEGSWFNFFSTRRVPRIVIGPGAVVKGSLTFDREVKLYVSNTASIGPVHGATVNKFSGEQP